MPEYDPNDFADPHDARFYNVNQIRTLIEVAVGMARAEDNERTTPEEIAESVIDIAKAGSSMRST